MNFYEKICIKGSEENPG